MTQVKLLTDAIDDFIKGCKADGNWDQIKACCIMAAWDGLNGALVPIKGPAPTNFNFVSADYNRKTGLKGDGATKYLNSNRANNADPQNDNHNAAFLTQLGTSAAYTVIAAGTGTTNGTNLISAFEGGFSRSRSSTGTAHGTALATGLVGASRSASASYIVRSAGVNETISVASNGALSNSVLVYRREGEFANFSNIRASFYSIGESIDLAALDARVTNLMTAIDGAIT